MMPALPQTSTAPTPSLLAMLTPVQGSDAGEAGAFEQLVAAQGRAVLAATPVAPSAVPTMPITVAPPPIPTPASANAQVPALPMATTVELPAAAAPVEFAPAAPIQFAPVAAPAAPVVPALPVRAPQAALPQDLMPTEELPIETAAVIKRDTAPADKAILAANELLATLAHFTVPAGKPTAAKPAIALPVTEGEGTSEGETPVATEATPVAALLVSVAAPVETRPAGKPAAEMAPTASPRRDDAPALPTAAPKARGDAPALPMLAALEPAPAKPAAEPSMTVLFAQPAVAATTALGTPAPVATIAERVLDLSSDDAWIEQLAADIAATKSASGDISFRLMPRHLGRLDVSMMAGDEGVSVRLDTQHEATATIVTAAQTRLADDLRQQGVRVADTQVTHTPADTGRQFQQNQGQSRGAAQDAAHLIETATEREPRETPDERAGERRGRFA